MLFGCMAIVVLAVSAVVMWWKRRPRGHLAAPPRGQGEAAARNAVAVAVMLGLLYPLLGASMLVGLAIDRSYRGTGTSASGCRRTVSSMTTNPSRCAAGCHRHGKLRSTTPAPVSVKWNWVPL